MTIFAATIEKHRNRQVTKSSDKMEKSLTILQKCKTSNSRGMLAVVLGSGRYAKHLYMGLLRLRLMFTKLYVYLTKVSNCVEYNHEALNLQQYCVHRPQYRSNYGGYDAL
jgi:hypothetical protein